MEDEQFDYALRVVKMARCVSRAIPETRARVLRLWLFLVFDCEGVLGGRRLNDEDPRLFMEYFNLKRRVPAPYCHMQLLRVSVIDLGYFPRSGYACPVLS